MRRQLLQRGFLVLLLVVRLIVGEFAHAMPHSGEAAPADTAAAAQPHEPPCPDHAGKATEAEQPTDAAGAAANADHDASRDTDCCRTTGCECLCVHISAIAIPCLSVNIALLDQSRVPASADGLMQDRLSVLFRPPA